jgi:predicted membrane protein
MKKVLIVIGALILLAVVFALVLAALPFATIAFIGYAAFIYPADLKHKRQMAVIRSERRQAGTSNKMKDQFFVTI